MLKRGALGFWFCGLGVLGLLRFYLAAFRDGQFAADTVAWMWLVGSTAVFLTGMVLVVHALRHRA